MRINREEIINHIPVKPLHLISETTEGLGIEVYVIGGYARDILLNYPSRSINVVAVSSGTRSTKRVAKKIRRGAYLSVFRNFETAQVEAGDLELRFVGAREESYSHDNRKPVVEDGILEDDQNRRDLTINALALCLSKGRYEELIDPFDGLEDMDELTVRTPLDPGVTLSDDPLRMMRAIRFATQLNFFIDPDTFDVIIRNRERISIISGERTVGKLSKTVLSPEPSTGFDLLDKCGLLPLVSPELYALRGVETKEGIERKDNFIYTSTVLDRLSRTSDSLWLRRGALFHDITRPTTKRFNPCSRWAFRNRNFIDERMTPGIFRKVKLPTNEKMKYMQKMVSPRMRPIVLSDDEMTDSVIRRLLFGAGDNIDDLMKLYEADITSENPEKVRHFLNNFRKVRERLADIEEKDRVRSFQPSVPGEEIMETFSLVPSKPVGVLKETIESAILDGAIPNEYEAARQFLI